MEDLVVWHMLVGLWLVVVVGMREGDCVCESQQPTTKKPFLLGAQEVQSVSIEIGTGSQFTVGKGNPALQMAARWLPQNN